MELDMAGALKINRADTLLGRLNGAIAACRVLDSSPRFVALPQLARLFWTMVTISQTGSANKDILAILQNRGHET